jgi:hypothetical protein
MTKALQKLYNNEINASISTFWDGGFTAKLGEEMSGVTAEGTFDTLECAEKFLLDEAKIRYPQAKLD